MTLHHYPETDSLYIDLSEKTGTESHEISPGIVLDYDDAMCAALTLTMPAKTWAVWKHTCSVSRRWQKTGCGPKRTKLGRSCERSDWMTVTLDLKPEVEAEVTRRAEAAGADLQEQINRIIAEAVKRQPSTLSDDALMERNRKAQAVLRQWREEDKTDDLEEIARRQAEWEEFRKGMNEHHSSGRIIYP